MELKLKFGKSIVTGEVKDENIIAEVSPAETQGVEQPLQAVKEALANPIGSPPLREIVRQKQPQKVAIVVNDITRPTPYKYMLPPLMEELAAGGVKDEQIVFVIATGIHRGNDEAEQREMYTDAIVDRYRIVNHSPDEGLASLGKMSDGTELIINKEVAEADLVITTGLIGLHYFAGYSGGRKSILPGVASRDLITSNHAKMTDPRAATGVYKENPVHWIMTEAARMAGLDFIFNVVTNSKKEIVSVIAGDMEQAWLKGVQDGEKMSVVKLAQAADVVIASAGGHPKDINVYQAQKALDNAQAAVRPGGTVILVAECAEGFGEDIFEEWIRDAAKLDDIFTRFDREFVLGGHKAFAIARVLKEKQVIFVTGMSKEDTEKLFFKYAPDLRTALDMVKEQYGEKFAAYLMPEAGLVLPQVE